MVRFRNTNLRISATAELAANHEGYDPREIALVRQHLQVEHQFRVFLEGRRHAGRLVHWRDCSAALFLRLLDAAFEVADGFEIFLNLPAIGWPDPRLEIGDRIAD